MLVLADETPAKLKGAKKGANFLKAMKKRETFQTIKKPLNMTFIKTLKQLEIFPSII